VFLNNFLALSIDRLKHSEEAQKYLSRRSIPKNTYERFEVGFWPYSTIDFLNDGTSDFKLFQRWTSGFSLQDSLIFPIKTAKGNLQGICVRAIKKRFHSKFFLEKYQNSGKIAGLYTNLAFAYECKYTILVEGIFDMMAVDSCGFPVFACMTASVTRSQAFVLSRYIKYMLILFDNDEGGCRSKLSSLEENGIVYHRVYPRAAYKDIAEQVDVEGCSEVRKYLVNYTKGVSIC